MLSWDYCYCYYYCHYYYDWYVYLYYTCSRLFCQYAVYIIITIFVDVYLLYELFICCALFVVMIFFVGHLATTTQPTLAQLWWSREIPQNKLNSSLGDWLFQYNLPLSSHIYIYVYIYICYVIYRAYFYALFVMVIIEINKSINCTYYYQTLNVQFQDIGSISRDVFLLVCGLVKKSFQ